MGDRLIVFGYLLVLVLVGLRGGRRIRNANDFLASGKRCNSLVLFATLSASFIGGGYSAGNAAAAYEQGIGTALALCGFSLGMILIGRYLVPGIALYPHAKTVGDILGTLYGPHAQTLTGLFSFLCCAGVVGAQMESIGLVFQALLGVSQPVGTVIGGTVVLLYTTFGGMESVIAADMLQFALLAVGMPLLLFVAVAAGGGPATVLAHVPRELLNPLNQSGWPAFLSLFFSMMCGEALAPPYMQRLLIGKTPRETARGTVASGVFSVPFFFVTAGIGLTARALGLVENAATVMPTLILRVLPTGLRGLLMAAMASIILSAADGFLNGATVSLMHDALLPRRPHMSDRAQLRCLRLVNLATGLLAMTLSFLTPHVFAILLLAYSFWSPVVLVPLSAALLGLKTKPPCLYAGMAAGMLVCLLWNGALHRPLGIDGCAVGTLANLAVFVCRAHRYPVRCSSPSR